MGQVDHTFWPDGKGPLGPLVNARVGVQYALYGKFNGARHNFDGGGAIDILLEEYRTLRAESMQSASRYNYIFAACAAAEAWAFSASGAIGNSLWLLSGSIVMLAIFFVWLVGKGVWDISQRLRQLEGEINARAGNCLLVWEQLYGGARGALL